MDGGGRGPGGANFAVMDYVLDDIMAENSRRRAAELARRRYNPLTGEGACGPRVLTGALWLPQTMLDDAAYSAGMSDDARDRLRCRHDFEYWAARCVRIRHKLTGRMVNLTLNSAQRRVTSLLEEDRRAGRPLRMILLKARQWGGSTLVEAYMAWLQTAVERNWNSLICAQVGQTASSIRRLYDDLMESYPPELWTEEDAPAMTGVPGMANSRRMAGRGARVTVASSFSSESVRGLDYQMAHMTEVAFWKDSERMTPEDFVRGVTGGIAMTAHSMVVLESTANGMGNYFHREWLRAEEGRSALRPVFVGWQDIDFYELEPSDPAALLAAMDAYEWELWRQGLSLHKIAWYHDRRREMSSDRAMMTEFPTRAAEAFAMTGHSVFAPEGLERLREGCRRPGERGDMVSLSGAVIGERALEGPRFVADQGGEMEVWERPRVSGSGDCRYIVAVDIGGRSRSSDWSVITVFDRQGWGSPEVVAQWRGHCDHDLLGWRAAMVARWYDDALLVIESNTLETDTGASAYILDELAQWYDRLYSRRVNDSRGPGYDVRPGFHTNRTTKAVAVETLIAAVRDGAYVERCAEAIDEMAAYEQRPDGSFGAKRGSHDDMVMTRAIALYVARELGEVHADGPVRDDRRLFVRYNTAIPGW